MKGRFILLVTNENDEHRVIKAHLEKNGIAISLHCVDNKKDLISQCSKKPQLIMVSLSACLDLDSHQIFEILKELKLDCPVFFIFQHKDEEMSRQVMQEGAEDYFLKDDLLRLSLRIKRELTQSKKNQNILSMDRSQYEKLLDFFPDAFFVTTNAVFVYTNAAACRLFGVLEPSELIGHSIYPFIHPDCHEIVKKRIDMVEIQHQSVQMIEEKFIDIHGKVIEVEVIAAPYIYQGKPAVQVFARNISERKRFEAKIVEQNKQLKEYIKKNNRLKYADLMKSEFMATMSHELRTPLNAIIGFSEVLKDGLVGALNHKQNEYCNDIYNSGQHLLALINDILDLSKVDAGKMNLELEPVDLHRLLEESLVVVKEKAALHNIKLKLAISGSIDFVSYDARKIKQIVYNLLSNAVKFTPDGSTVTLSAQVKNGNIFEFVISDMGKGIAEVDVKKLFRPFEQLAASTDNREKGTGLGLMIAKKLVELHGGAISVKSTVGKGTSFIVELPYYPIRKVELDAARGLEMPGAPKAIVIEDDPIAAELISLQLKELGLDVIWKETAEEVLSLNLKEPPDLIVLDILLPGMDGIDLMARLKNNAFYKNVPVIIVSIVANEKKSSIVGAIDVLQKPIGRNDLSRAIQKYVRENSLMRNVKVLIAEDDKKTVEVIKNCLKDMPCEVRATYNGKAALEAIHEESPDVIILDLLMPRLNGFEVIEMLKKEPKTAEIPIIILSSKTLSDSEQKLLRRNAISVLRKEGFNVSLFRQEVKRVILG